MPGIDQMQLGLGQVLEVRLGSFRDEGWIVPSPDNECRRLVLAKEVLPFRVGQYVVVIVLEKLHLDFPVLVCLQERQIMGPTVRAQDRLFLPYVPEILL